MSELNPNHPMTQAIHDQWYKFCALIMSKYDLHNVIITMDDIHKLGSDKCLAVQEKLDGLHIRLIDLEEAEELARKEGGLPS